MRKKAFTLIILLIICLTLIPCKAFADTGPKPSVRINLKGLASETYYVTLLSEYESTGPYRHVENYSDVYDGNSFTEDIWNAFQNYKDSDNYYFISFIRNCTQINSFAWTYYPPYKFKILIYFPEKNSFICSDIMERYAFDSYFTVSINEFSIDSNTIYTQSTYRTTNQYNGYELETIPEKKLEIVKSYNALWEILSLIIRIIITIAIELFLALLFKYNTKNIIKVILLTNIITQILLNITLYLIDFYCGNMIFTFFYILLEIIIVIIEAVIYRIMFNKRLSKEKQSKIKPVLYSIAANSLSFLIGLLLAVKIPGIF